MTQALVQVGMQVVAHVAVFFNQSQRLFVAYKLLLETAALRSLVIRIGNIADGNALTAVSSTNPVGVWQVNADGRSGIFVASQHSGTNHVGRHTFYYRLAETRIYWRVILEPLGVLADGLCAMSGLFVDILHQAFPRTFQS